jgi:glycine oxidase
VVGENGRVTGVECDGTTYLAAGVVNAAGSWAGLLALPAGARRPPVTPRRGQIVVIGGGRGACEHALYSSAGYLVPRRDGRILAGSTYEEAGYQAETTVGGLATILAAATALVPALGRCAVVDAWAGLRPVTPDGLPVLGPSPDLAGLYYATGHGRHGILLAPLTARLIAELIVGGEAAHQLEPFLPGRFGGGHDRGDGRAGMATSVT